MASNDAIKPLDGLRVLDMSRVLAGPWAGQIFADLGAEVIKIERPGTGDDTRAWGPPFLKDADGNETAEASYYLSVNRGKKSVAVDIHHPEGQSIIRDLARSSDILIENFKVGGLQKYGLDYENLSKLNKRLIYLSITGFGQTGPYAARAGYDFIIQAMGGLMSITGEKGTDPGAGPQKVGVAVSDLFCGLYGVIGVLAAVAERHQTGQGRHVDMALLDSLVSILSNQNLLWLVGGVIPKRMGNAHASIVPYEAFETADSSLVLAVGNDRQYAAFCEVAGDQRLRHENYQTNPGRVRHRGSLIPIIQEVMRTKDNEDWLSKLEKVGVPAGPINSIDKVFEDPQITARGLEVSLEHPLSGSVPSVLNPFMFDGQSVGAASAPPLLGQHTDDVLTALGLDRKTINALKAEQIVA